MPYYRYQRTYLHKSQQHSKEYNLHYIHPYIFLHTNTDNILHTRLCNLKSKCYKRRSRYLFRNTSHYNPTSNKSKTNLNWSLSKFQSNRRSNRPYSPTSSTNMTNLNWYPNKSRSKLSHSHYYNLRYRNRYMYYSTSRYTCSSNHNLYSYPKCNRSHTM